ncbi:MAG: type II toxin-antitoxin system HicA family toxin [Candidatus Aenigmarchaeota archaeon]|nr:type II toxin-antitoxin system HicA family toxin [Candidatus Aenigmarchaeota archaeon]
MTQLPVVSSKDVLKVLTKSGYYIRNQRGSHIHLRHPTKTPLTVPNHATIAKGTLIQILRAAEITKEEFTELLKK